MTKKRYRKLARAYFTRLNEWAKKNSPSSTMDMGKLYRTISTFGNPIGMTRAEWWAVFENTEHFGVGDKAK